MGAIIEAVVECCIVECRTVTEFATETAEKVDDPPEADKNCVKALADEALRAPGAMIPLGGDSAGDRRSVAGVCSVCSPFDDSVGNPLEDRAAARMSKSSFDSGAAVDNVEPVEIPKTEEEVEEE